MRLLAFLLFRKSKFVLKFFNEHSIDDKNRWYLNGNNLVENFTFFITFFLIFDGLKPSRWNCPTVLIVVQFLKLLKNHDPFFSYLFFYADFWFIVQRMYSIFLEFFYFLPEVMFNPFQRECMYLVSNVYRIIYFSNFQYVQF